MPGEVRDSRPTLLRWNDHLTGRSCTLRIADSDVGCPLTKLVSKYLTDVDPVLLADEGKILPGSVLTLLSIQDVSHMIDVQGALLSLAPGTVFRSEVRELDATETPPQTSARVGEAEVALIDITIDRSETGYSRNWQGFNRRRWQRSPSHFESFVEASVGQFHGNRCDEVLALGDYNSQIKFLEAVASAIWEAPFENYSRFTGERLRYKTGDEALAHIIEGRGAICSEKVQALKFITDHFGFESHYVLAGPDTPGPVPVDHLRHVLDTFDFRGAAPAMRFWQHMALEYVIDGEHILVDATNGNIPFLLTFGSETDSILDDERPKPITTKMGTYPEKFYYHRAPDELALDLCYAMENFIPEIDLVQVFDNELGLALTSEFLVTPLPYRSAADFDSLTSTYNELAEPRSLAFDVDPQWRLKGPVGIEFTECEPFAAEMVMASYTHLVDRYNMFEDEHHEMGLAVIRLHPDR